MMRVRGVVIVASGHGGAVPSNPNGGVINWDPTDGDVDRDWLPGKVNKGLFWDDMVARYLDPIPLGNPPNQKGIDEQTSLRRSRTLRLSRSVTTLLKHCKRSGWRSSQMVSVG